MTTHSDTDIQENLQIMQNGPTAETTTVAEKAESDNLLDGTRSKYLTVLYHWSDIGDPETHEKRDSNLLKALAKEENARFKNPKTDADYIGLMRLLATHSSSMIFSQRDGFRQDAVEQLFVKYYLEPEDNREETRAELFKLVKLCFERKKFKPLRNLGKPYILS